MQHSYFIAFALICVVLRTQLSTQGHAELAQAYRAQVIPFCNQAPRIERQPNNLDKKVISYALFSDEGLDESVFEVYLRGMEQNVKDARLYYPEWIVRIYVLGLSDQAEAVLLKWKNAEVVRCSPDSSLSSSSSRKMIARFLVIDDPKVAVAIVRDSDSLLTPREIFAVNSWLSSGLLFHVMRDHAEHDVPVLGGMFGMRRGALRERTMASIVTEALEANPSEIDGLRGEDQSFLMRYVWPIVKSSCLAHDIDIKRCRAYDSKLCQDFPLEGRDESSNFFVGASFKGNDAIRSSFQCSISCSVRGLAT